MMYGYLSFIALPLIVGDLLFMGIFVRKLWKQVGYSQVIFFLIIFVKLLIDIFISTPERQLLVKLFTGD